MSVNLPFTFLKQASEALSVKKHPSKFKLNLDTALSAKVEAVTASTIPSPTIEKDSSGEKFYSTPIVNHLLSHPFTSEESNEWIRTCLKILNEDFSKQTSLNRLFKIAQMQGANNSYILYHQTNPIAIIKPSDEEIGYSSFETGPPCLIKNGIESSTMAFREVLAYEIFSDIVPETALAMLSALKFEGMKTKACSIQKFITNCIPFSHAPNSLIISVKEQLYPVVSMDLLLGNVDRHGNNLLIFGPSSENPKIIAIDHGCILSANSKSPTRHYCWLNIFEDEEKLPSEECLRIESLHVNDHKSRILTLLKKACYVNTFAINVILAQKFCRTKSIKEIAMYHLQNKEDFFNESPLTHNIIMLAALHAGVSFSRSLDENFEIPIQSIKAVVDEVAIFVEQQKELLNQFLIDHNVLCDEERWAILHKSSDSLDESIDTHLVYEQINERLSILFLQGDSDYLKSIDWKDETKKFIFEKISLRLQQFKDAL